MKKTFIKAIAVILCFLLFSFPVFSVSRTQEPLASAPDAEKVLQARLLNMLNHNFVYGSDFADLEKTVNGATLALLDQRENEESPYISQSVVNGYLFDMYGITIDDFSAFNSDFPQKDGYLYMIPRGFSIYEHEVSSFTQNEDGTLTLITDVTVKSHDSVQATGVCKTMFVKNIDSAFGYNIVYSEIVSLGEHL